MGNLCGKESRYQGEGRTLGDSTVPARQARQTDANSNTRTTTSAPSAAKSKKPKVGGPGRTLAGGSNDVPDDPREAARLAAERRAKAAEGNVKQAKLMEHKKTSPTQAGNKRDEINDPGAWA